MPPPWEQLQSWVALVEVGSVSGAAKRLGISQAGVSQQVKQLEEGFGANLLDRSTRPARPTSAGQRLFEQAKELLSRASRMDENVRSLTRSRRALVRVGCVDSFAAAIGPALVRGLVSKVQRLRLVSGLNPGLSAQFADHQLDIMITTDESGDGADWASVPLFSEQFLLALPGNLEVPPAASLTQLSQIRPFMHYSSRSRIGTLVDDFLRVSEPTIPKVFEFDATDPLLSLVSEDLGIALTTPLCLWQSRFHSQRLKLLSLSALRESAVQRPPLLRTFYLVHRYDESATMVADLVQLVRVAARDLQRRMKISLPIAADNLMFGETSSLMR